ncbi:unnamed protein product, partial [Urochloa humidicola]
ARPKRPHEPITPSAHSPHALGHTSPPPTTTTTMAVASLSRLSRRATTSAAAAAAAPSLRRLLSATSTAPAAPSAPPPPPSHAAAAAAGADRVRWDYRGQRQLVPLRQWMPKVAVDAYVAPEAVLAGQVTVHDGASVWSGAVLRGDLNKITLGFCANVQERCVLHAAWAAPTDGGPSHAHMHDTMCILN